MSDSIVTPIEKRASVVKPWLKYFPEECRNHPLPALTMYSMVKANCTEHNRGTHTAMYYYGTELTYFQMLEKIEQYAAAFEDYGVKAGEYVSIISVSLPETIFSLYALNKLGAVCNFIDPRTDTPHTREFIKKAKSRICIVIEQCYPRIKDVLDDLGLELVICQNPGDSLPPVKSFFYKLKNRYPVNYDGKRVVANRDFIKRGKGKISREEPYVPNTPAVVTRTGGTTGVSKGVVLTNDSMNAEAVCFSYTGMLTPDKRTLLNFLPIAASYGIAVGVHMIFSIGARDVLIPVFKIEEFDELIIKYKPNHIIGVPVFYEYLINSPKLKGFDMSFIGAMAAGGDSANSALEDKLDEFRIEHNIQYPIAQGYGMSEVSSAACFGVRDIHRKGSAGIPIFLNTIAAFEPGTENELPMGQTGEIYISGATVMKEYLDEPEETANVLFTHADGTKWVHSGDLGYVDEDGFVFIVGRIKRSIIRFDGHKVYPLQIENEILKHKDIARCCVIGVKDLDHIQGYLPLICVQLKDNNVNKSALRKELLQLCMDTLELRSQPIDVEFLDEIPLTGLMKNDIRAMETMFSNYNYKNKK